VRELTIVPMFLGVGRHAREDLPELVKQLRAAHPDRALRRCKGRSVSGRVLDSACKDCASGT
jgi:sirohydrochlorin ferrochelatase